MDIRTKLIFALVVVALGSMLALGLSSYPRARALLRTSSLQTLEGIAESKANDLQNVTRAWRDRVLLISSRTQLRVSLLEYGRSHSNIERDRIQRILDDAAMSAPAVRSMMVYDSDEHLVAAIAIGGANLPERPTLRRDSLQGVQFLGLRLASDDSLAVAYLAPLGLAAENVGSMVVVMSAHELVEVTEDLAGLGATGEIIIAYVVDADSALIVNPLRNTQGAPLTRRIGLDQLNSPIAQAALGNARGAREDAIDYRGRRVWAASRYLEEMGWGLVVKFDADEQELPILELRSYMIRLALSLSAFAILIATALGLHFARPIHALAEVANRIRAGDMEARADASSSDEVGELARTFNLMTEKLIETNQELERRIAAATNDTSGGGEKPPS